MPAVLLVAISIASGPPARGEVHAHPAVSHQLTTRPGLYVRVPGRAYGTEKTVRLFAGAVQEVRRRFPGTPDIVIGDLSFPGGGRMRPHRSHRTGRDVDAGYYFADGRPRRWFTKPRGRAFDVARTWALFETLIDSGEVEYIFVSYRLQRALYAHARRQGATKARLDRVFQWPRHWRKKAGIIRLEWGHDDHFHVRFKE